MCSQVVSQIDPAYAGVDPQHDGQPRAPIAVPMPVDEKELTAAVNLAQDSDYVVAVIVDRIELVGKGKTTATLELIDLQIALLDALAATGNPLVIVLMGFQTTSTA